MNIPWSTVIATIIAALLAVLCAWLWRRKNGNMQAERASDLATENSARCRQLERRILAIERRLDQLSADIAFARAREGEHDDHPDQ